MNKFNLSVFFAFVMSFFMSTFAQAAELDGIGSTLTGELDGAKAVILSVFAIGAIVLGIFAGYRYLKRGANSA